MIESTKILLNLDKINPPKGKENDWGNCVGEQPIRSCHDSMDRLATKKLSALPSSASIRSRSMIDSDRLIDHPQFDWSFTELSRNVANIPITSMSKFANASIASEEQSLKSAPRISQLINRSELINDSMALFSDIEIENDLNQKLNSTNYLALSGDGSLSDTRFIRRGSFGKQTFKGLFRDCFETKLIVFFYYSTSIKNNSRLSKSIEFCDRNESKNDILQST